MYSTVCLNCLYIFEAAYESIGGSLSTTFDLCKISVSAKVVICHEVCEIIV